MTPLVFVVAIAITAVVSAVIVRALAGRQLAETRGALATQLATVEQDNKWLRDEVERHKQTLGSTRELLDKTDTRLREMFECEGRRFHFVGHQANLRMLENVRSTVGIPPERHHTNCEWYGNTGAASSASVLSMNWDKWRADDDVAVVGVGAGLTWSSYLVRFGGTERAEPSE